MGGGGTAGGYGGGTAKGRRYKHLTAYCTMAIIRCGQHSEVGCGKVCAKGWKEMWSVLWKDVWCGIERCTAGCGRRCVMWWKMCGVEGDV